VNVLSSRPKVLLADDHAMLLDAFQKLLEPRCDVAGKVTDGRALLEAAPRLQPDVIVVDIGMPLLNGLEAARRLKQSMPTVKLIVLTMNEDPDIAAEAIKAGASAYLLKKSAASELFKAIQEVLKGRTYFTPQIARAMEESFVKNPWGKKRDKKLTPRQREVLQLLAEGRSMKEIADILDLTPRTVAFHKYRIMEVLGVKTTADLIQFAVKTHLV
jgi:DNA-binding NarL/FixJ family response regulator